MKLKSFGKYLVVTAVLGSFALVAAGCGSGNDNKKADATKSSVKKVVYAFNNKNNPYNYIDDKGNLVGYEVDVAKELDKLIPEYEFELDSIDEDSLTVGLDTGRYAVVADGFYKNADREQKYLFPKENNGVSLIKIAVNKDSGIKTLDDVPGHRLAPLSPSGGIYGLVTKYNEAHPERKIDFVTQENNNSAENYKNVNAGKYDAVISPNTYIDRYYKTLPSDNIVIPAPIKVVPTWLLVNKDNADLRDKIDVALKKLKDDGTLSKLATKWFGEDIFQYKITQ